MIPAQHAAHTGSPEGHPHHDTHDGSYDDGPAPASAALAAGLEKATADAVAEFNLDDWIGAVARPEADVPLWNPDPAWEARYAEAITAYERSERRLAHAIKAAEDGAEVSITDTGTAGCEDDVEQALRALDALRLERDAVALVVRLRQRTPEEMAVSHAAARKAGVPAEYSVTYAVADAIVAVTAPGGQQVPAFTGKQLYALARRDTSGFTQFVALRSKLDEISARPSVPSWPGSSTSRGTGESSAR